ncbi:outer membrane beta-barrel protein [Teredinibacter purpureus]|uniref:outer membrane beta-barrel protein n=1 Tax=Teredinibacter purpureus TaxID=2731756 RepID=UPI0005F8900C|nr:outer membrane beta-barrel protein [Teredinibacter purpureus]
MFNPKNVFFGAVLAGFSTFAFAGSDTGMYLGGSLGMTSSTIAATEYTNEMDDDYTGYKVFAGYNFGLVPMIDLAVEASYVDFGTAAIEIVNSEIESETTAWDVYGLAGFNTGPIGFFGKVGLASWESELQLQGIEAARADNSGSDLTYGVGAKIQLMSVAIRAEYEYFDFEHAEMDMISIGAAITF